METTRISVHPRVAAYIIDMQMEHDLPVELHWSRTKNKDGEVSMVLMYELEDYNAFAWLLNKSVIMASIDITSDSCGDD